MEYRLCISKIHIVLLKSNYLHIIHQDDFLLRSKTNNIYNLNISKFAKINYKLEEEVHSHK